LITATPIFLKPSKVSVISMTLPGSKLRTSGACVGHPLGLDQLADSRAPATMTLVIGATANPDELFLGHRPDGIVQRRR